MNVFASVVGECEYSTLESYIYYVGMCKTDTLCINVKMNKCTWKEIFKKVGTSLMDSCEWVGGECEDHLLTICCGTKMKLNLCAGLCLWAAWELEWRTKLQKWFLKTSRYFVNLKSLLYLNRLIWRSVGQSYKLSTIVNYDAGVLMKGDYWPTFSCSTIINFDIR